MKTLKNIAFSALLCIAAFTVVTYVACNSDKCKDTVCQNGGTCSDGTCVCLSGYEGTNCQTLSASKFLNASNANANYSFNDAGSVACGGTFTGNFTMALSGTDNTKVILTNFGGFGSTTTIFASVDGNVLTIPTQTVTGTSVSVSGSGTYSSSSSTITGSYSSTDLSGTCTYSFTWTKL